MTRAITTSIFATFLLAFLIGCSSGSSNPSIPDQTADQFSIPITDLNDTNRTFLGSWNADFNMDDLSVDISPNRSLTQHYNITTFLPAPGIFVNSYDPSTGIADVDVTITNPNVFGGYDLRLIIYSDDLGHILKNSDNWTNLWDIAEAGPLNGFKAYAKTEPGRLFAGQTQHTENLRIFMPGGNFMVQFAIDASFPTNCEEPYVVKNFSHDSLLDETGAVAAMQVDVHDWQDDIQGVYLYCPAITMQTTVPFTYEGGKTWSGILTNNAGEAGGKFPGVVVGYSGGQALFDSVTISISQPKPKYDWAITLGGDESDVARTCVSDANGDVYVAGTFQSSVDFDPGAGISNLTSLGEADSYVAKYNNMRELEWVRGWGGPEACLAFQMAIDSLGNCYVLGRFYGTVDFDPGGGIYNETAQGTNCDTYLSKFSSTGTWQWTKVWGGEQFDDSDCIAVSPLDDVYTVNTFYETADFMPGPGTFELTSKGMKDFAIIKFDSAGTWQWASSLGGVDNDVCNDIVVNSAGDILMTGGFWDTMDFDPNGGVENRTPIGRDDAYICQWDSSANFIWVTTIGGTMNENSHALVIDSTDSVCIAGTFGGTMDFDPGPDVDEYSPSGWSDIFITKYNSMQSYQWTRVFGGASVEITEAISVNSDDNIVLAGSYEGLVDFNPGLGEDFHQSNGVRDSFLNVLSSSGGHKYAYTWGGELHESPYDVDAKYGNTIYVCGYFRGTVDFDPGSGTDQRESNDSNDLFISKFE